MESKRLTTAFARIGAVAALLVFAQNAMAQSAPPPPPDQPGPAQAPQDQGGPPPGPPPPGAPQGGPPPGVVNTNVNLRQGPGTNYTVLTTIPAGSPVGVGGCQSQWCQVSFHGENGYVIASSLGAGGPPPGGPPPGYLPPAVVYVPPPYYGPYYYGHGPFYGGYGGYGWHGYYGGYGGWHRRW